MAFQIQTPKLHPALRLRYEIVQVLFHFIKCLILIEV
ncbi:hypothetical protein E2320_021488 [Naja naja]|nr:hypothetical protein E2320_021488 [Naja naja]